MKRIGSCRPIFRIGLGAVGVSLGASLSLYAVAEDAMADAALVRFPSAPNGNQVLARDPKTSRLLVDGIVWNVDGATPQDSYNVQNGGVLNVSGATTGYININGSTLNMESSTARGDVKSFGGVVNINQSVVVSDREALTVIRGGNAISVANVSNSSLSGGVGANVGGRSELNVSNSQLAGVGGGSFGGLGVVLAGATVNASNGSLIVGSNNGLLISIDVGNATDVPKSINSVVVIDGSEVQGLNGPAIKVTATPPSMVSEPIGAVADITFQNHSTLLSGNGNLLEVDGDSTVKFTVDDSTLTGNLVADDTSTLNVTLQNNAQLTGDVINGNNLSINSGAQWQMVGDNAVKTLNLNGGGVNFGADGFHTDRRAHV